MSFTAVILNLPFSALINTVGGKMLQERASGILNANELEQRAWMLLSNKNCKIIFVTGVCVSP